MDLFKKLCETPGISGNEERIQKVIKEELEKITDEVKIDKLGNVIGIKKAKKLSGKSVPKKSDDCGTYGRDWLHGQLYRQRWFFKVCSGWGF